MSAIIVQDAVTAGATTHNSLARRDSLPEYIQSRPVKAIFDVVVATAILLWIAPVMVAIALAVACDGGPVLFSQTRIGRGGRKFGCLKFRTMAVNSDELLADLLRNDPEAAREWEKTRKLKNDPRVTRVGAFLRKTSLDELPQLLNIIFCEMSLVGPRPIVEQEISRYGDDITYYYAVRPGLTGLWQVSGRSETSYDDRVKLDVTYVKRATLQTDLGILLRTLPAVVLRKGAY